MQKLQGDYDMTYAREIIIAVLIMALCLATYQCDRNKGKLATASADRVRQQQISSAQAGRGAVRDRETNLYPGIDQGIADIEAQRAKIKAGERKPAPSRKDVENEVNNKTQGDIHNLARLFVLAGYSCSVR
jgi:hypothetical protein